MKKIELLESNPSILLKDKNRIKNIFETFDYSDDTNLIPQCFWGNIKDPKIIILAKNPSCVDSDYLDNKHFRKELIENLNIEERSNDIVNLLFSSSQESSIPFELSGVSNWWRSFFSLSVNETKYKNIMDSICIINLCGYYKTSIRKIQDELFWFYDDNKSNKINDIVENVFKNEKLEHVIFVWSRNDNPWNKILKTLNVSEDKVSCADKKNLFHPYINVSDFLLSGDGEKFYYPIYNKDKNARKRYILDVTKDYKMSTLLQKNDGEENIYNNSDFICENMKMLICRKANSTKYNQDDYSYNEIIERIDELHAVLYAFSFDDNYQRYKLSEEEIDSIEALKNEYKGKIEDLSKEVSLLFVKLME